MSWFLKARNALILVLSWATAMAPLQSQAMAPKKFDMYKKAIESSGLAGAKPVKLKDFYRRHQAKFPRQMQFEIENFLRANPNADAPKLTVTKVKNQKGTDDIRVLISFNGANQTVTIVDDGTNFMQVGSATLKYSDFYNPTKLFSKVEKAINMKPDSWRSLPKSMTTPFRMATYDQMKKMNLATRTEYIKGIQDLLVTMEKMVPGEASRAPASKGKKTSSLDESVLREINFFMSVIVGRAEADGGAGQACVAAGYASTIQSGVCKFKDISGCSASQVLCNPKIFGRPDSGSQGFCVGANNTATAECQKQSKQKDVAKEFDEQLSTAVADENKKANWDQFRNSVVSELTTLQDICNSNRGQYDSSKVNQDQENTCTEINTRLARINQYTCSAEGESQNAFTKAHPQICNATSTGAGVQAPVSDCRCVEASLTVGEPERGVCDASGGSTGLHEEAFRSPPTGLGARQTPTAEPCSYESGERRDGAYTGEYCVGFDLTERPRSCPAGERVISCSEIGRPEKYRCGDPPGRAVDSQSRDSASREGSQQSNRSNNSGTSSWKNWLMIGGIVLAGFFVMDWAWKDATQSVVDRVPPTPQPPVTVPPPPPFGGIDGG